MLAGHTPRIRSQDPQPSLYYTGRSTASRGFRSQRLPDASAEREPDMWLLYQLVFGLGLLASAPILLIARGAHYRATVRGRLGHSALPRQAGSLWVHAVSVGEVGVAQTLLGALGSDASVVVTTVTPTGQDRARASLAERASVAYLPFDLGFAIRRFLDHFSPRALILIEGEYWPLLMRFLRRRNVPIAVVNGRVSDRSFRRMRRLRPLLSPLFAPVERFGVQTDRDRERLIELGAPADRVITTGNLKFESPEPVTSDALRDLVVDRAQGRPVLVAGSTMRGEESLLIEAFRQSGGGERALLVVAPRHPERWDEVDRILRDAGMRFERRSQAKGSEADRERIEQKIDVLLLDSLGELAGLYRLAQGAYIGGTLVPTGGHNPLEAARFGVPVVVGPSMENFREIAEIFDRAGAWQRAKDLSRLAEIFASWWNDPESARAQGSLGHQLIAEHRGALERTLKLLGPMLERTR